jgi:tRNA-5-taurinomethyluridine 2-sulfurtransferase
LGLSGGPWYVVKKDIINNIIYISRNNQTEKVMHDVFNVLNINWIPQKPNGTNFEIKLRHGPHKHNCQVDLSDDSKIKVKLELPDQGISAGQFAIFYDNGYCLGGGVIEQIS